MGRSWSIGCRSEEGQGTLRAHPLPDAPAPHHRARHPSPAPGQRGSPTKAATFPAAHPGARRSFSLLIATMFRQAVSRASALARQSSGAVQRRHMAEAVAADKLLFNFFLPGGTIQKDAVVVRS